MFDPGCSMDGDKKTKAKNFSEAEKDFLTDLVISSRHILEAKFDASITQQMKDQVWADIHMQLVLILCKLT
jgi:hypothetical protein